MYTDILNIYIYIIMRCMCVAVFQSLRPTTPAVRCPTQAPGSPAAVCCPPTPTTATPAPPAATAHSRSSPLTPTPLPTQLVPVRAWRKHDCFHHRLCVLCSVGLSGYILCLWFSLGSCFLFLALRYPQASCRNSRLISSQTERPPSVILCSHLCLFPSVFICLTHFWSHALNF